MAISQGLIESFKEMIVWGKIQELAKELYDEAVDHLSQADSMEEIKKEQGKLEVLRQVAEWPDIVYSRELLNDGGNRSDDDGSE